MSDARLESPALSGFDGQDPTLSARLAEIEQHYPSTANEVRQLGGTVEQLRQSVVFLSQQRAVAELQLERHTRATALDLAIKAAPNSGDSGVLTALAEAFLAWIKVTN